MRHSAAISVSIAVFFPLTALASVFDRARESAVNTAGRAGLQGTDGGRDIYAVVGSVIGALLGLVGVVFLVLVIYGGFLWMTAGGNTDQVTKAKSIMLRAGIGAVIVFSAYAFTVFVFDKMMLALGFVQ